MAVELVTLGSVIAEALDTELGHSNWQINVTADGYVTTTGSPATNQLAVFTDATTVQGVAGLTWDGSDFATPGGLSVTSDAVFGGNISLAGNATITGNENVSGDLDVLGNTELSGTLAVVGNTTLSGDLDISGNTTASGDLAVIGAFNVADVALFDNNVSMLANLDVSGNITVSGTVDGVDIAQLSNDVAALANGMVYAGNWDASGGSFPGSGVAQIGAFYTVSVGGTVDGEAFEAGDRLIAIVDNASTTTFAANWTRVDATDAVQSVAGLVGTITDTALRTALNVEDGATADQTGAEIEALLDAELGGTSWKTGGSIVPIQDDGVEIVAAPSDLNFTGAGVTVTDVGGVATIAIPGGSGTVDVVSNVAQDTILGRTSSGSGDSEELTPAQVRTLLNVEDGATADQTGAEIVSAIDTELGGSTWQSGGAGSVALDDLTDVDLTTSAPTDGQALIFDNASGNWVPGDVAASSGGSSGGSDIRAESNIALASNVFESTGLNLSSKDGVRIFLDRVDVSADQAALALTLYIDGAEITTGYDFYCHTRSMNTGTTEHFQAQGGSGSSAQITGSGSGWGIDALEADIGGYIDLYGITDGEWKYGRAVITYTGDTGTTIAATTDFRLRNAGELTGWKLAGDGATIDAGTCREQLLEAEVAGSGGGGGTPSAPVVPVVRGQDVSHYASASSTVVNFPAGSAEDDTAIIFAGAAWDVSTPSGWVPLDNQIGSEWQGGVFAKVLTAADITAGSVTVNFGGAFEHVIGIVVLEGRVSLRDQIAAVRQGTGSASRSQTEYDIRENDLVLMWASNRGSNSVNTFDQGTELDSGSGTNASATIFSATAEGGPETFTASYGTPGSGLYQAVLVCRPATGASASGEATPAEFGRWAKASSAQSAVKNAETTIAFDTEDEAASFATLDTGTGVFTINTAGTYLIMSQVSLFQGSGGDITVVTGVKVNGTKVGRESFHYHDVSWAAAGLGQWLVTLEENDTVEIYVTYPSVNGAPSTMTMDLTWTWIQMVPLSSSVSGGDTVVTARYWRIADMDASGFDVGLAEVEFRGSVGGPKLSGTLTASSSQGSFPIANADDGNPATDWVATTNTGQWVQIDLGLANDTAVAEVMMQARSAGPAANQIPESFTVQYSDNGSTWTTIYTGSDTTNAVGGAIRTYEVQTVPAVFTNADQIKLDAIEAGATADQTGAEIVSAIDTELGGSTWQSGGGSTPAQDDGVEIVAAPTALNFTGAGVTVTDNGGVADIDIPGGGGTGSATSLNYQGQSFASSDAGASLSVPRPSGATDTSTIFMMIVIEDGVTPATLPPAGWTELYYEQGVPPSGFPSIGATAGVWVGYGTMPNSTLSLNISGTNGVVVACAAFENAPSNVDLVWQSGFDNDPTSFSYGVPQGGEFVLLSGSDGGSQNHNWDSSLGVPTGATNGQYYGFADGAVTGRGAFVAHVFHSGTTFNIVQTPDPTSATEAGFVVGIALDTTQYAIYEGGITVNNIAIESSPPIPAQDDGVEVVAAPTALNFTGAGVTVTDVGGVATIDVPGGGGSMKGFRATLGSDQVIPPNVLTTVTLGTEEFDTENAYASGVFTVPAELDGQYMMFTGGVRYINSQDATLYITRNVGEVDVEFVTHNSLSDTGGTTVSVGPIQVSTGQTFELQVFDTNGVTINSADARSFFSGFVIETANATNNFILDPAITGTTYNVTDSDLRGNVYKDVTNGAAVTITVPSGLTGTEPFTVEQNGAGQITFAAGGGVTINSAGGLLSSASQYSVLTLIPKGSDVYTLSGDLS